ncbi:hypothetical protein AB0C27_34560 [Nonomuraea sp. NPDC048882]|uniref:hypothetical protein n=1 Tax=Nonomuraea sp. NPDC048882 TaxID=3154347 RepID=UPI00340C5D03
MRIALLGPVRVLDDDARQVTLGGARSRALVARLALDAGRAVPSDALIDDLLERELPRAMAHPHPWARAAAHWVDAFALTDRGDWRGGAERLAVTLSLFEDVGDRYGLRPGGLRRTGPGLGGRVTGPAAPAGGRPGRRGDRPRDEPGHPRRVRPGRAGAARPGV